MTNEKAYRRYFGEQLKNKAQDENPVLFVYSMYPPRMPSAADRQIMAMGCFLRNARKAESANTARER